MVPAAFGVFAIVAACGNSQTPQPLATSPDGGAEDGSPSDAQTAPDEEAAPSQTETSTQQCVTGDGSGGVSTTDAGCELNLFSSGCSVRCSCPEDLCWCNGSSTPVPWGACPGCKVEGSAGIPPFPCHWGP